MFFILITDLYVFFSAAASEHMNVPTWCT